jgi:hypothetical protein
MPELQAIAAELSNEDISQGKPTPPFVEGQIVEVIVNARNTTYRKGRIRSLNWNHKEGQWIFFLEEDSKNVSKRYEAKTFAPLRPNPSIERTGPGKPGRASHVKR